MYLERVALQFFTFTIIVLWRCAHARTHAAINIGIIITFRPLHALFFCSFALWCRPFVVVVVVVVVSEKGNAPSSSSSSSSKTTKKKNIDGRNDDNKRHLGSAKPARRTGVFLFLFLLLLFKTISNRLGRRWYSGKHHNLSF